MPLTLRLTAGTRGALAGLGLLCAAAALDATPALAEPVLPMDSPAQSLGVAGCANSVCHSLAEPFRETNIQQNEALIWQGDDRHSKAHSTLRSKESVRIAKALGLPDAESAPVCLSCHANFVPPERRSVTFNLADGVSCEACHGPAQNWVGPHLAGDHQVNVAAGLYPLDDPMARGKLCLSCHLGDERHPITHRIMGAGHPRIKFELDTFTWAQPAHFTIDEDYRQRKIVTESAKVWAIGQGMAAEQYLNAISDPARNRDGLFPEYVNFDCHACHHPTTDVRWQNQADVGLPPGVPRLNTSSLVMLRVLAGQIDPGLANQLRQQTLALHQASQRGPEEMASAARGMAGTAQAVAQKAVATSFDKATVRGLISAIATEGAAGTFVDYVNAEQAAMALSALIATLKDRGEVGGAELSGLAGGLDGAYAALGNENNYSPAAFVEAMRSFQGRIPAL
ncbi:multiheme c-type cytochrome [Zavarzinia sp. CC-PAN008]|uniref:multiheme c-type cytochrome n=1 Tax=Zavarzinia sp. CC-PAN008 TaxID=3243332 RepID=UPI003F7449F9